MTMLSNLIGLDASRLARPRRLALGLTIFCLTPAILITERVLASPAATF